MDITFKLKIYLTLENKNHIKKYRPCENNFYETNFVYYQHSFFKICFTDFGLTFEVIKVKTLFNSLFKNNFVKINVIQSMYFYG